MQHFLRGLLGFVLGGVVGIVLAALLGDPIGRAFNVSNFEGGRGYFVFLVVIPLFAIVGAVLGAVMIYQGRRFNLSVLAILFLAMSGFAYTYRVIFFNLPFQTEKIGNFELQSYENESFGDNYGFRYQDKRFDIEEYAGKEERKRRVNAVVLITPTTTISTIPLFLAIIGPPYDTRSFYLAGEKNGAAFASYLCDTTIDAVDSLDNQPPVALESTVESRQRIIYLHRKEISGSRWLLLGDACVLDLQSATAYPFTSLRAVDSGDPMVDRDHLPVALSPDMRSLVRIVVRDEYDAKTSNHLGKSLHLLVNNFVDDTSYTLAIDPQRMRYNRSLANSSAVDDIDQQWLDHHFEWQKGEDGHDRLVERSSFTPWAYRGWVSGYEDDLEYRLKPVKPELIDKVEEFLVAQFGAKRIAREHSAEGSSIDTLLTLQIEDKELSVTFRSDDYSSPQISLWQSAPDARNGEWLKKIAVAINQLLQSGDYDEYFVFEPYS